MEADLLNLQGGKVGTVDLSDDIYGLEPRADILHRCVRFQQAARRQGTRKTKERNEVKATSRKHGRQKGSGGARHGNRTAPQFRGGGNAHGPRVRSHAISLPRKIRRLALRHALSAKYSAGDLLVIDEATLPAPKTKLFVSALNGFGIDSVLVIDSPVDGHFALAARNVPCVDVLPVQGANVYDILRRKKLILTRQAVCDLEGRLK